MQGSAARRGDAELVYMPMIELEIFDGSLRLRARTSQSRFAIPMITAHTPGELASGTGAADFSSVPGAEVVWFEKKPRIGPVMEAVERVAR